MTDLADARVKVLQLQRWDKKTVPGGFHVKLSDVLRILAATSDSEEAAACCGDPGGAFCRITTGHHMCMTGNERSQNERADSEEALSGVARDLDVREALDDIERMAGELHDAPGHVATVTTIAREIAKCAYKARTAIVLREARAALAATEAPAPLDGFAGHDGSDTPVDGFGIVPAAVAVPLDALDRIADVLDKTATDEDMLAEIAVIVGLARYRDAKP